jgi:lipid-binding SYLF domain-containing protein
MDLTRRSISAAVVLLAGAAGPIAVSSAHAEPGEQLAADGRHTLAKLEATDERAARIARRARAALVFPSVLKAGFFFGGQTGNGVLLEHGRTAGFYNLTGGSWGLQIGGQDFSYVLFFMNEGALGYLDRSAGFSAGTGPSIVVINQSAGAQVDTTTLSQDVYAFPFNGKGLMADLTLQGTKITRIHPG